MKQSDLVDPLVVLHSMAKELGGQKQLADKLGYKPPYISDILNGRRDVTDKMLAKIGLRRVVVRASAGGRAMRGEAACVASTSTRW